MEINMRDINQPFRYHLPQLPLFYALAAASVGLFMLSFFTNSMLLEDRGSKPIVDIAELIASGVDVYMTRTIPMIVVFLTCGGAYVWFTAGWGTLLCFIAGAMMNVISAKMGVKMAVHSIGRIAHCMGQELSVSLQLGIRTGAIGGLLATSLALGGMAGMWLFVRDTNSLSGFGSGASIVSFYLRVGGGIFSKGAEIGGDLIGEMEENRRDEERRIFELQQRVMELEDQRKERAKKGLNEEEEDMMDQLRMMEEEMQDVAGLLHPINYMDAIGDNICDVSGQCADLFESMVLILSTSAIIGAKGSAVPSFFSGLPFWITASGSIACALVATKVYVHERHSPWRIRFNLRLNLVIVIIFVQLVQLSASYVQWFKGSIDFETFVHFSIISLMGQLVPEICVLSGEYFTSLYYQPVKSLAANSSLGVVQTVLQGLGQGFISVVFPAITQIVVVMVTWSLQGHYGLALLGSSSVSGTAFQGGIASYGAIAAVAHKIVHLTTYHSMTRTRANMCYTVGMATNHAGNMISAINAFSAVFNISVTLLAKSYTRLGLNYKAVAGAPIQQWSQAGLVTGVFMTFLFAANTTLSCLDASKSFMRFCKESEDVQRVPSMPFPHSHRIPLKILTTYGTVTSMRMVFSPMIHTLAVPLTGGFFLGIKGLLFLISGSNVLVLCLSVFLLNSGRSWCSARRLILLGLLRDSNGELIGPESAHYDNLGVGQMIGGPFEDTTGPALNNFIKFVGIFALVTEGLYQPEPNTTWMFGFGVVVGSLLLIGFSKFGLTLTLNCINNFLKQRQLHRVLVTEDDEEESEEGEEGGAEEAAEGAPGAAIEDKK
jgi:K(+)-stimulated pyrophosphate-energized sodium pump